MRLIERRIVILFTLLFVVHSVFGQKHPDTKSTVAYNNADQCKMAYALAMKYGDYTSATQSVYGIMSLDTTNHAWNDTLANLFFMRGLYQQCISLAGETYKKQPGNNHMLELLAVSEQALGNDKESLAYYEKLYAEKKQLSYLYQMVILQFDLKRIGECSQNIETIVNDPAAAKEQVLINEGQGYQQQVPYKAAVLNIRGVIANGLSDTTTARKSFEESLKTDPDFAIAKSNLEGLNKTITPVIESDKSNGVTGKK